MNIILQNYENLITNLIKDYFSNKIEKVISNFNNYSIYNYIDLISSIDNCAAKSAARSWALRRQSS